MHKKNKKRAKPSVSLAHRKKCYFVTPDEDMRVLWSPNHYIAKYIVRIFKDYIPYNDSIGATPFCHEDENGMPWPTIRRGTTALRKCSTPSPIMPTSGIRRRATRKRRACSTDWTCSRSISQAFGCNIFEK